MYIPYYYLINSIVSLTVNTKKAVKIPVIAIEQCQVKLGKFFCEMTFIRDYNGNDCRALP